MIAKLIGTDRWHCGFAISMLGWCCRYIELSEEELRFISACDILLGSFIYFLVDCAIFIGFISLQTMNCNYIQF